ncbi:hypothetical protein OCL06_04165 [Alteromonas sp. ASW11-19]|uniref:Cardiolipin synthase N-terminal domain-containing protein n=1 Tax=Alteromonas salexigens TaxID=2982530 RepID=A0ABT2VKI3_9ALTE|nr:hypothetical protein [Alteromonas salexigens]MCU7553792.1 hypothetical protein [Alteromonas salexigens]
MFELFFVGLLILHLLLAVSMSVKLFKQSKIKGDARVILFLALWLIPLIGAALVSDFLKVKMVNKRNGGVVVNSPGGNGSGSCSPDSGCD